MSAKDYKEAFIKKANNTPPIKTYYIVVEGISDYRFFRDLLNKKGHSEILVICPYSELNNSSNENSAKPFDNNYEKKLSSELGSNKINNNRLIVETQANKDVITNFLAQKKADCIVGIVDSDFDGFLQKTTGQGKTVGNGIIRTPTHDLETYLLWLLSCCDDPFYADDYDKIIGTAKIIGQLLAIEKIKCYGQSDTAFHLSNMFNNIRHNNILGDFWSDLLKEQSNVDDLSKVDDLCDYLIECAKEMYRETAGANKEIIGPIIKKIGNKDEKYAQKYGVKDKNLGQYRISIKYDNVVMNNKNLSPQDWCAYDICNGHDIISLIAAYLKSNEKDLEKKLRESILNSDNHLENFWNDSSFGGSIYTEIQKASNICKII